MKLITAALSLSLGSVGLAHAAFRPDIKGNVEVAELEKGQTVPKDAKKIELPLSEGSNFIAAFECKDSAKSFTYNGRFVGCCLAGQHLSGDEKSGFSCCGSGHDQCGSAGVGFACCLKGWSWDGKKCIPPKKDNGGNGGDHGHGNHGNHNGHGGHGDHDSHGGHDDELTCANGKYLVNGKCVCNPGTIENCHGKCVKGKCTSGIETGKCYTILFPNGLPWGYEAVHGYYGPGLESRNQKNGRFTFCTTQECPAGVEIDPGEGFRIKDIMGVPNTGAMPNAWLNNYSNGGHITKTLNWAESGVFTITKWPCGKYCLSGLDAGLGPTCPADVTGVTFTPQDPQSCMELTLIEVPCDIKNKANNCVWRKGKDQCCDDKVDCTKKANCPGGDHPDIKLHPMILKQQETL